MLWRTSRIRNYSAMGVRMAGEGGNRVDLPSGGLSARIRGTLLTLLSLTLHTLQTVRAEKWVSVDGGQSELRVVEYCETEIFHAECPDNEIIVMRSANYGRMKFGRCVDRDYGYVGCQTDVLRIADAWCSGRQKCDVPVPNSAFRSTQPCPKDLKPYFEAEYTCARVESGHGKKCVQGQPVSIPATHGYLAKIVAEQTGLGTTKCPWLLEGQPGQTISITLLDFSLADWPNTNLVGIDTGVCHVKAVIREKAESRGVTVCGGAEREKNVYTSVTHVLEIRMLGPQSVQGDTEYYVLKYEVHGCADPEPPPNAWLERTGDRAEIGCDTSDQKWKITCNGNTWEGSMGNCSQPNPVMGGSLGKVVLGSLLMPFEVSLIIITAIAVAIGIIILSIGLICLRWRITKRNRGRQESRKQHPPLQNNTYNGKTPRVVNTPGSQDSFPPPPPPEVDHEQFIAQTENEYAYIADMPPPPPIAAAAASSECSDTPETSDTKPDPGVQKVFHDFYPTTPTPYEQSPTSSPYHSVANVTPKLLAHECALAARADFTTTSSPYGQRSRRSSNRSRVLSESMTDPPTYFELEPEDEVFSFVMHMPLHQFDHGGPGSGGVPGNPPPPPAPPLAPELDSISTPKREPKIGPKTAPKPSRHAHIASNRISMPHQFTNGTVADAIVRGKNTL